VSRFVHAREALTDVEREVQAAVTAALDPHEWSVRPVAVGLIGLIGSGKSTVARGLALRIGATIVDADQIRIELGKRGAGFDRVRAIAENVVLDVLRRGGSVIVDSDFVDVAKRASLVAKVGGVAQVLFVQTFCDYLTTIQRISSANYEDGSFYHAAALKQSTPERPVTPAHMKLFELSRRTPHHCAWSQAGGGQWRPRKFDYTIGSVDTGASASGQEVELDRLGRLILTGE
jgi:predicted kinase